MERPRDEEHGIELDVHQKTGREVSNGSPRSRRASLPCLGFREAESPITEYDTFLDNLHSKQPRKRRNLKPIQTESSFVAHRAKRIQEAQKG
jgi:hypothetical protein